MIRSMAALLWRFQGRLALAVHSEVDPSNLEWAGYVRDTLSQPDVSTLRILVITYGGGPTGAQRRELTSVLKRPAPTALLSNRFIARGLVNALSWFNPKIRAFRLNEDSSAYEFLELTNNEQTLARRLREQFEGELGLSANQSNTTPDRVHFG